MSVSIHHNTSHAFNRSKQVGVWSKLTKMIAVSRQRRALAQLDDHLLADIGITAVQAHNESEKPAWDVPRHWQR